MASAHARTDARTHTQTQTHTVNDLWPRLYQHDWYSNDSQALWLCTYTVSVCVSVCCFELPGSLGNNWCKSSINFTDRGVLCASFTYWAPVCRVIIHSRCTIATKYHSSCDAFHWFCIKVNIHAGEVVVLGNSVILSIWEFAKASFSSSPHSIWFCEWDFPPEYEII